MPRVHLKTKNRGGKHVYLCTACGKPIEPKERYYQWEKRYGGPRYRHLKCGYPRPSQLSDRKTAVVEDAVLDAGAEISAWHPELPYEEAQPGGSLEIDTSDLAAALEGVASEARSVGEEYSGNADNMPDALQYGSQAEAMRDVGQRLDDWASELDSWSPSAETTVEVPGDYSDSESDRAALQEAWDAAVDGLRTDAQDALDAETLPEYEG